MWNGDRRGTLEERFLTYAMPVMVAGITMAPPAILALGGRDLDAADFLVTQSATGVSAFLLRFVTFSAVMVSLAVLLARLGQKDEVGWRGAGVLVGFLAYFATNSVLNAAFGTVRDLDYRVVYAVLLIGAVYGTRAWTGRTMQLAVKSSLLIVMLASFAVAMIEPRVAVTTYAHELRLPLVPFRLWGLGNNANSFAAQGLLLLILTIEQPYRQPWLTATSAVTSMAAILLAQSETIWVATALVVPSLLVYRGIGFRGVRHVSRPEPWLSAGEVALVLAASAAAAAFVLSRLATTGIEEMILAHSDEMLNGRGRIWQVALQLFHDNALFGYGLTAWDEEFRAEIGMPFAFHAHNQFLQSLSVGGLLGLAGLMIYLGALGHAALRLARPTGGAAPAMLVGLFLMRMVTEVPFALDTILADVFLPHVALFHLLVSRPALPDVRSPR
jgi:O-antigen ligase